MRSPAVSLLLPLLCVFNRLALLLDALSTKRSVCAAPLSLLLPPALCYCCAKILTLSLALQMLELFEIPMFLLCHLSTFDAHASCMRFSFPLPDPQSNE